MKRKERILSFQLHVIQDRQGTDRRLRSFRPACAQPLRQGRAEPLSEQIHKFVSHEDVNFTEKNGRLFLKKTAILKLSKPAVCPLHAIATQSLDDGGGNVRLFSRSD